MGDEHVAAVYGFLARQVSADVAEVLTPQVFARAHEDREPGAERGPADEILVRLLGAAVRVVRGHGDDAALGDRSRPGAARRPAPAASEWSAGGAGESDRLEAALRGLSADEREILQLNVWADLDVAQIARALRLPPPVVRDGLGRAKAELGRAFLDDGPAPGPDRSGT